MSNEEKYLLVEESIAPDIFKKVLAEYGANILTINQNIPSDGIAAVTVSIRMTDVTLEEQPLMQHLRDLHGVVQVSKVS